MARSYSRIASSIWRDEDFLLLTAQEKLVYLMLISQADISPCGLLPVTLKRWARAAGLTMPALREALTGLSDARYIVTDDETEELLVRSFIKWDGGSKNDMRAKAIRDAVEAVSSARIFDSLLDEMDRISIPHGLSRRYRGPIEGLSTGGPGAVEAPRVVVTEVSTGEPQPSTLKPARIDARSRFDEFWAVYPRHERRQDAIKAWAKAIKAEEPDVILAGAVRYRDDPNRSAQFTAHPSSWLNSGRWSDDPLPPEREQRGNRLPEFDYSVPIVPQSAS